ncbi:MAG: DUF2878 domain-containing protein [Alphaproteobacteria bacterium]|nr:DUF2878 domain-containing protein [Alphaproteobacteria bacterium]
MSNRPNTRDVIVNVVAFQAAWLALVIGAANGFALAGQVVAVLAIALHLMVSPNPTAQAKLIVAAALLGLINESVILSSGFVSYASPSGIAWLPPAWLIALWPVFATSINVACRPARGWTIAAIFFGLLVAPIGYIVGANLGAMSFSQPQLNGLAAIGLAWAVSLPVLLVLARRWDGWR